MTEEEILALSQVHDYEDGFLMNDTALGQSDSESGIDSDQELAQVDVEIPTGLNESEIMGLAQVQAMDPTVKMTPQVHVQVTRVGH